MYTINPLVYLDKVASNISQKPVEKVVVNEVKVSSTTEEKVVAPTPNVVTPVEAKPVEDIKPITSDPVVVTPTTPKLDSVVTSN
jgi:hypothetical protein